VNPGPAAIELAAHVRPGDTVVWGQACAEPLTLTAALRDQAPTLGGVRCFVGIGADGGTSFEGVDGLGFVSYGGGGTTRRLDSVGRLDVLTSRYSDLPQIFTRRRLPVDVALLQATPGDEPGTFHLALAVEYLVAAARSCRAVILEVNAGAPHSPDAPVLRADQVAAVVHADHRPVELASPEPSDTDRAIASRVAEIVADGATLQLGIGSLPEAIARGLRGHRDLGVHSGTIGDAVVELVEQGAVSNSRKGRDHGVSVGGVLMGSARLFAAANGNRALALRETGYTHDPRVLASLPCLTTINAAVEIDLTGQVNCEVAGGRYVGAAGGSLDFARGAALADGGTPITVLRSRAGSRSTIVPALSGPVTIPRSEVGWVVTEHGAVDLRGLTLSARRQRLLELAHPDHRGALEAAPPGPGEPRAHHEEWIRT
jgi:acetyl-CoA hydrolase